MAKAKTGMGADAFFQTEVRPTRQTQNSEQVLITKAEVAEKSERRSFNLRPSILKLLDEIQIKTMREDNKWTLSSIIEHGIELVAAEMGVSEPESKRTKE